MLAALAFLRSPLGKYAALGLAIFALALGLMHIGAQGVRKQDAKRTEAARADLAKHEATAAQISTDARNTLSQRQAQIIVRTHTIVQRIKEYVPAAADARCVVPVGFVQLHDAAAAGEIPRSPGGSDPSPSGVPLSAVAATVADNYGTAYDWRAEVMTWRAWYVAQKAAWEKR